ncbi:MAG: superoxide dismutase family protein [Bdellovibrionota bacterium]
MSSKQIVMGLIVALLPSVALAETHNAEVTLEPKSGSSVKGTLELSEAGGSLKMSGTLSGLTPGKHGFHVHEVGDCSAPDASSAGGHFNPGKGPHAGPTDTPHHLGDLGNIDADSSGMAKVAAESKELHLSGDNSIIGKAVVVHKGEDDLKTQPSGGSGDRVACGVVRAK